MDLKKILAAVAAGVGTVFVVYSGYNLMRQAMRSWEDFYIVSLLVFLAASLYATSRVETARVFVTAHSKSFLKASLSLTVVSLLVLPLVVIGTFLSVSNTSNWSLPDWAGELFAFGIATLGMLGLLLAILPAYLVFAEHLRSIGKRQ